MRSRQTTLTVMLTVGVLALAGPAWSAGVRRGCIAPDHDGHATLPDLSGL